MEVEKDDDQTNRKKNIHLILLEKGRFFSVKIWNLEVDVPFWNHQFQVSSQTLGPYHFSSPPPKTKMTMENQQIWRYISCLRTYSCSVVILVSGYSFVPPFPSKIRSFFCRQEPRCLAACCWAMPHIPRVAPWDKAPIALWRMPWCWMSCCKLHPDGPSSKM